MKSILSSHPFRALLALLLVLLSCERAPSQQGSGQTVKPSDIVSGISLYGIPENEIIAGETSPFDIGVSLSGEAAKHFSVSDAKLSATDDRIKVELSSPGTACVTPLHRGESAIRVSLGSYHRDFPVRVSGRYYVIFDIFQDCEPRGVYARMGGTGENCSFAARCSMRLRVYGKQEDAKTEGLFKLSSSYGLVLDAGKLLQDIDPASLLGILDVVFEPVESDVLIYVGRTEKGGLVTRLSAKYPDGTVVPEGGYPEESFPEDSTTGSGDDNPDNGGDDSGTDPGSGGGDDNSGTEPDGGEDGSDTTSVRIKDESIALRFDREKLYSHHSYAGVYVTRGGNKVNVETVTVTGGNDVEVQREGPSGDLLIVFNKPGDHVLTVEVSPDTHTTYWNEISVHVRSESILLLGLYKYDESGPDENSNVCAALVYECRDPLRLRYSIRMKLTGKVFGGVSWEDVCAEKTVTLENSGRHVLARYPELYSAASKHYLTKKIEVHIEMKSMSEDMDCLLEVGEGIAALMSEFGDDVPVYINGARISGGGAVWMRF